MESKGKQIRLYHFSRLNNLTAINPKYAGTGQQGAERNRLASDIKESCFYCSLDNVEYRFKGLPCYTGIIPKNRLYLKQDITYKTNKELKRQGYIGWYSAYYNQVRLFKTIEVEEVV